MPFPEVAALPSGRGRATCATAGVKVLRPLVSPGPLRRRVLVVLYGGKKLS